MALVPQAYLQLFIRNQLTDRNTLCIKTVRISHSILRVADSQDINRLQIGRKVKFFAKHIRLKIANPYGSKPQLRGL